MYFPFSHYSIEIHLMIELNSFYFFVERKQQENNLTEKKISVFTSERHLNRFS